MEKRDTAFALARYLLILLAAAIALTFGPANGRAGERPAGETSGDHPGPSKNPEGLSKMFQGTVAEVIEAGRHIYIRVDSGKRHLWVAVPAFDGKPGDKVQVPPGVPVANFHSRKLNRKFDEIIFVGAIRRVDNSGTDGDQGDGK
jgi:hypothetical protein